MMSKDEGLLYKKHWDRFSVKVKEIKNKPRITKQVMTSVLRCAEDIHPYMLYAIWSRIVEENHLVKKNADSESGEYLRES
jgi:hypothetical protein